MNNENFILKNNHLTNRNNYMDSETAMEYKRVLKELRNQRCLAGSAKKDFSRINCILNNQERFNSIHCFSFPVCLQIELTNRCNLKCVQCGVVNRKEATLPVSLFRRLWKILPYLGGMTWLGGEVFLVDYFLDLLKSINLEFPHLEHTIYTNALLLDENIVSALADINNLQLKFSIDSIVKEIYEQLRSLGKFDILLNNLSMLNEVYKRKSKKPRFGINVIAMKKNIEQLIRYPDFCKEYGITHLDVSFLADCDPPHLPEEDIFEGADQVIFERVKDILQKTEIKCREYKIPFFCNFNSFLNQTDNSITEGIDARRIYNQTIITEQTEEKMEYVFRCYYSWTSLFIKCNGLVVPTGDCIIPVGNILKDDLLKIWNGKVMQVYRYKLGHSDLSKWCSYHCQQKVKVNKEFLGIHSES